MGVILGILFAVLAIGAGAAAVYFFRQSEKKHQKNGSTVGVAISAAVTLCMVGCFIFIPFGFVQVNTGEAAVVKVWGEATELRMEGLHFKNIISTEYVVYDVKTQEISSKINAYSKDAQSMTASLVVQFRVQTDKLLEVNRQFGSLNVLTQRVKAISEEKTKVVLSSESAMDLIANRQTLSSRVETSIKGAISQYYIDITMVALTDITFSDAFESTVEQKMIAEQEQLRAEYEKQKAITEAERDLEVAKLNAQKAFEVAQGEANAQVAVAEGQAKALKLKTIEVARMLGFEITETVRNAGTVDEVTEYNIDFAGKTEAEIVLISEYIKYINYLEVWNGQLPTVIGDGSSLGGIIITP